MTTPATTTRLVEDLERDGIAVIPDFLDREQLRSMQQGFDGALRCMRWNDVDGYEKTEPYRHMVQNVLTLDQGFVDLAIHPAVKEALTTYIGGGFELVEAKGWLSLPTMRDFHGWHGDAWYDQKQVTGIPREVKLAFYLTDVSSGYFEYIRGTHRQQAPRPVPGAEVANVPSSEIVKAIGSAGTMILFDTSGIHRQSVPILHPRRAVFYNYHDPSVPLQREDIAYYRYHPLLLNAAFLGDLTEEDRRILGFGDKTNYIPHFQREPKHESFQRTMSAAFDTKLRVDELQSRVAGRMKRVLATRTR